MKAAPPSRFHSALSLCHHAILILLFLAYCSPAHCSLSDWHFVYLPICLPELLAVLWSTEVALLLLWCIVNIISHITHSPLTLNDLCCQHPWHFWWCKIYAVLQNLKVGYEEQNYRPTVCFTRSVLTIIKKWKWPLVVMCVCAVSCSLAGMHKWVTKTIKCSGEMMDGHISSLLWCLLKCGNWDQTVHFKLHILADCLLEWTTVV